MDSSPICHLSPAKKNEMLIFGLCSTSDDQLDWSMDSNAIHHPSPAKNMKCLFLDYVQLLMISQACRCTRTPFATSLQPKKIEMLIFWLCSTSDDQPGWSMDLNPICHPSPAKKMKCSFLDYIQLLIISQAGRWTWTPSTTHLQPKTWNAPFWITFNFWWLDRLVNGLKPHLPPVSSHKNEMLIFGLRSTSDDWLGWSMDSNPISSQNNEMLIFGLHSTSDDQLGWSMDSNPVCHLSPATKMKCSFLDYIQLLMIGWPDQCTRTPSAIPLQPQKGNAHFWITFNFLWSAGWSMDSNPIHHPSPAKKMKCSFLDYIQLLMIGRDGRWTQTPSATSLQPKKWNAHFWIMFNFWWLAGLVDGLKPHLLPLSSQKHEILIFGLCLTYDGSPGWLMDSNPICQTSSAKIMKCSFLDYVQLLMIGQAVQWTQTPSATPLQPQKWNPHFWITSTSYDQLGWSMDSNPICNCSAAKKMKCSFLDFVQLLMIGQAGPWTQTPSATPLQPKK